MIFLRSISVIGVSVLLFLTTHSALAQTEPYVSETDSLVLKKLDQWQDWKFGLLMHWGPYSQWGIVESWSICAEDVDWCRRPKGSNYVDYVKQYEKLPTTFNPVQFDPDKWAKAASDAGMKYVVFTTKHHDGFNMFDTKFSDYKITAANVPFHRNPRADVTKEIFKAFRRENFGIGAYFSKPDWHSDNYWDPFWATPDRNTNYDTTKHPDKWNRFKDFTYNQIDELTTGYGKVDILWLDGGWVRPGMPKDPVAGSGRVPWPQDIDMPRIAGMARKNQPGIIIVDRDVHGQFENYRTPEQKVPDAPLPYPWETCMTMATSWSYVPNDVYKPSRQLIHTLVDVVAKGGNFLLNIGPSPKGDFAPDAYTRLRDIAAWMSINNEAIYNTRPIAPYKQGKVAFTSLRDGTVFAIYMADENETAPPASLVIEGIVAADGAKVSLLGFDKELSWKRTANGFTVDIPDEFRNRSNGKFAWTLRISKIIR
ncbi:MAG TPA: alpha-L-fucosidase [Pyrinomonadaceae bacterium]|nr:alpha-L-fucosidase [Acidobacteriota bacterium]HQZ97243.1 alpha-L-fucosidase [Pyrinomonadaceae bacterium]